jgi:hypothetical protein
VVINFWRTLNCEEQRDAGKRSSCGKKHKGPFGSLDVSINFYRRAYIHESRPGTPSSTRSVVTHKAWLISKQSGNAKSKE